MIPKKVYACSVLLSLNLFAQETELSLQENQETITTQSEISSTEWNNESSPSQKPAPKTLPPPPALGDKSPPYNNPNRFVFDASFIYWQAYEDGLEYGSVKNLSSDFIPIVLSPEYTPTVNGGYSQSASLKDKNPQFKWDPGFKVGIGTIFGEHSQWDILLNWTWLKSKAKGSFQGEIPLVENFNTESVDTGTFSPIEKSQLYIIPSWGSTALGGPASQAKSNWLMHYNTIDLEFGRNFFLANQLTLRPHFGLRGAFIHQNLNAHYDSIYDFIELIFAGRMIPSSEANFSSQGNRFSGKNDFDGIGLRTGLDAYWNFTSNFDLYAKMSGSLLYGRFKVQENFQSNLYSFFSGTFPLEGFTVNEFTSYDLNINDDYHRIRSAFQIGLGMNWHEEFNEGKQRLSISLGYEFNEWFEQNELRELILPPTPNPLLVTISPTTNPDVPLNYLLDQWLDYSDVTSTQQRKGDLGLQGLTFDLTFDF